MSLSIRNQLPGTVTSVTPGEVMAAVKVRLDGGQDLTAAITAEAVKRIWVSPRAPRSAPWSSRRRCPWPPGRSTG